MVPEVQCDIQDMGACRYKEQAENEETLRALRERLREDGWVRRWVKGELLDICSGCVDVLDAGEVVL